MKDKGFRDLIIKLSTVIILDFVIPVVIFNFIGPLRLYSAEYLKSAVATLTI